MLAGQRQTGGLGTTYIPTRSNLSTDLSDDHPVSFDYAEAAGTGAVFRLPSQLPVRIQLEQGRMECTSCHDPHRDLYPPLDRPLETGKFLRVDNSQYSALCTSCHIRSGLTEGVHYTEKEACEKCHSPHKAPTPVRLLREATDQDTCLLRCHNATGSLPPDERGVDIRSTFTTGTSKVHLVNAVPVDGVHDANENPLSFVADMPHVECVDCHNPCLARHETTPLSNPPALNGRIENVLIAKDGGGNKTYAITEYEICLKCHGTQPFSPPAVPRQIQTGDMSRRFATANPSFHPVMISRSGISVPSLRNKILDFVPERFLNDTSMIYCSDCHNSSVAAKVGRGTGPSGPHGSTVSHILMDTYDQDQLYTTYDDTRYALCFRCHDQAILMDPVRTTFAPHASHVVTRGISCSICHDPHGVPRELGGTDTANAHLINFDTRFVSSGSYNSFTRSCTVSCHGAVPTRTY
jgi:predicted CXXCH cytochrome family protein